MPSSSVIYITPIAYSQKAGPRLVWQVEISDRTRTLRRLITDPFDKSDHDNCRWYLETYSKESFDVREANRAVFKLVRYRQRLVRELDISLPPTGSIELVISEGLHACEDSTRTIHQVYWELLVTPTSWGPDAPDVRVRRFFGQRPGMSLPPPQLLPPSPPRTIEILLVAARNRPQKPNQGQEVSPLMALSVLAQISHDLRSRDCPRRLNITVIRPGTFDELKNRLRQLR